MFSESLWPVLSHGSGRRKGALPQGGIRVPVKAPLILTNRLQPTIFVLFRGHLSRPACSHVKKLAKQAGDVSDPGRTLTSSGRVFYGLM